MPRRTLPFISTIWRSSTSPAFYAELRDVSGWATVRYMALLILLITLGIVTVLTVVIASINAPAIIRDTHAEVLSRYPEDLAVTISGTGVYINQPTPYAVAMPQEAGDDPENPSALVVFVAEDTVTFSNFDDFDAYAVLSPTELYVRQDAGQVVAHDVAEMIRDLEEPVTVDHALLRSIPIDDIAGYWMFQPTFYVPAAIVLLLLFLYPAMLLLTTITVLLWSLVLWLVLQFFTRTRGLRFGKVYQMGAHAYTPILLIGYIVSELQGLIAFVAFQCFAVAMIVSGHNQAAPLVSASKPAPLAKSPAKSAVRKKSATKKSSRKTASKTRRKQ